LSRCAEPVRLPIRIGRVVQAAGFRDHERSPLRYGPLVAEREDVLHLPPRLASLRAVPVVPIGPDDIDVVRARVPLCGLTLVVRHGHQDQHEADVGDAVGTEPRDDVAPCRDVVRGGTHPNVVLGLVAEGQHDL